MSSNHLRLQTSLLKIPNHGNATAAATTTEDETLILMELPEDSLSTISACNFIGSDQMCLVTPDKSFMINRVETSNTLVLVPPPSNGSSNSSDDKLVETPCKLLGKGAGAFFLELKPKELEPLVLQSCLPVFCPFSSDDTGMYQGKSIDDLISELQLSASQIRQGLANLFAMNYNGHYALLAEEATQQVQSVILDVLAECDAFQDYASEGLNRKDVVEEASSRVTEPYPQLASAIDVGLNRLSKNQGEGDDKVVHLDFSKVAIAVARKLFTKQSVWSDETFHKEWQAQVPGVGEAYQVYKELLDGVATQDDVTKEWTCTKTDA